jgi:hypothetical protein
LKDFPISAHSKSNAIFLIFPNLRKRIQTVRQKITQKTPRVGKRIEGGRQHGHWFTALLRDAVK